MPIADQQIGTFLEGVAAGTLTPSGGSVAAIAGAAGAACCEMACRHTVGKDGYADVETEFTEVGADLATRRQRLLELADADATAVEAMQAAFEDGEDDSQLQAAVERATEIPLRTAEACLDVIEHAEVVTARGNVNALADAGTGATLAHAALQASTVTVRTNLELVADDAFVSRMADRADELERAATAAFERVRTNVRPG